MKGLLIKAFTSERTIAVIIILNSFAVFLQGFPSLNTSYGWGLSLVDNLCIFFFLLEAIVKISLSRSTYFKSGWNRFDFFVTIVSIPSLLLLVLPVESFGWLGSFSVLRAGRLLRFLRLLKFIPNSDHLAKGIARATKASVGIFIALGLFNITLSILATMFFGGLSPEHFGDPLRSSYTLLKMFTIEGWYEIPEEVSRENPDLLLASSLRVYAILTVLLGGILGMGLANAVFIDEMTADNNESLQESLEDIKRDLAKNSQNLEELTNIIRNKHGGL